MLLDLTSPQAHRSGSRLILRSTQCHLLVPHAGDELLMYKDTLFLKNPYPRVISTKSREEKKTPHSHSGCFIFPIIYCPLLKNDVGLIFPKLYEDIHFPYLG